MIRVKKVLKNITQFFFSLSSNLYPSFFFNLRLSEAWRWISIFQLLVLLMPSKLSAKSRPLLDLYLSSADFLTFFPDTFKMYFFLKVPYDANFHQYFLTVMQSVNSPQTRNRPSFLRLPACSTLQKVSCKNPTKQPFPVGGSKHRAEHAASWKRCKMGHLMSFRLPPFIWNLTLLLVWKCMFSATNWLCACLGCAIKKRKDKGKEIELDPTVVFSFPSAAWNKYQCFDEK